jgi:hypothetical protein
MRTATVWRLALWATSLAACVRSGVSEAGSTVHVVTTAMTGDCEELGAVRGESGGVGGIYIADEKLIEYAYNDLRNRAAGMGATHVYAGEPTLGELDGVTNRGFVEGMAYRCGAEAVSVADAVASRIRNALDDHAGDIVACVGREPVAVRVRYVPEPPLQIGLQGDLAGTAEETCVVDALRKLAVDVQGTAGEVIHLVRTPPPPSADRPLNPVRDEEAAQTAPHPPPREGGATPPRHRDARDAGAEEPPPQVGP